MTWLDGQANVLSILYFDFLKAFDSVSHKGVTDKLKKRPGINLYIVNKVTIFLKDHQQRAFVDNVIQDHTKVHVS